MDIAQNEHDVPADGTLRPPSSQEDEDMDDSDDNGEEDVCDFNVEVPEPYRLGSPSEKGAGVELRDSWTSWVEDESVQVDLAATQSQTTWYFPFLDGRIMVACSRAFFEEKGDLLDIDSAKAGEWCVFDFANLLPTGKDFRTPCGKLAQVYSYPLESGWLGLATLYRNDFHWIRSVVKMIRARLDSGHRICLLSKDGRNRYVIVGFFA